jgi:hypothetical protein
VFLPSRPAAGLAKWAKKLAQQIMTVDAIQTFVATKQHMQAVD